MQGLRPKQEQKVQHLAFVSCLRKSGSLTNNSRSRNDWKQVTVEVTSLSTRHRTRATAMTKQTTEPRRSCSLTAAEPGKKQRFLDKSMIS